MKKIRRGIVALLIALLTVLILWPDRTVVAEEVATTDKVTLNVSEIPNWTVGRAANFTAYVNGKKVTLNTLTWSSSNPLVATCENGYLVGISAGTTVVSCTKANGTTATCTVTVKAQDKITLNVSEISSWWVGRGAPFTAYVNGKKVTLNSLTWSSSNPSVATCENGYLMGTGVGTAVISCTKANGTTATCTVTVKAQDKITLNVSEIPNWTVGKAANFTAYVNGKKVTLNTLTWSSSNPSVATCENGYLMGISAGTTVISCTKANGTTATCTVTVKAQDKITLNVSEIPNWTVGKAANFTAYVNGKKVTLNTLTWSSSNPSVATCENGYLVGISAGTTVVSCTKANGTMATCTVTVKAQDKITLNVSEIPSWWVGRGAPFTAYVNGKKVTLNTLTWSSSNPSVATCDNGYLMGTGVGTAVITCTKENGTTATCTVTVKAQDKITLNVSEIPNWTVGKAANFTAYVNGKKVTLNTLTWSSSNPSVATCENGYLVGKSEGTTVISCTKAGATTATCTVTVKALDKVTLNTNKISSWTVGRSANFIAYVNGKEVPANSVIWSSDNPTVATCENGRLVGTGVGIANISCTKENGTVATCKIIVMPAGIEPEVLELITNDTSRWGMWKLTYAEFIEIYYSIGTEDDLFIKMLKDQGPRHTDPTVYYEFDGMADLEISFPDTLTEKIYALHYAPFEYNSEDYSSGNYGKDNTEAYLDHGGVCGILARTYHHFLIEVLGETSWKYCSYGNAEANHEVLLVQTEDGRVFQIDNCGVDYWWLGIEFKPDSTKMDDSYEYYEVVEKFETWKEEFVTLDKVYWFTFNIYHSYDYEKMEWKLRPIWYNYDTEEFETYLCYDVPRAYTVVYKGLPGKVISMAGNAKMEGYVDLSELNFK